MANPYYKVYSKKVDGQEKKVSAEEVQAALPQDVEGLTVDDQYFGYPCVDFPENTPTETMLRVKQHLEAQGFLPY